jgi:hypothetical protein
MDTPVGMRLRGFADHGAERRGAHVQVVLSRPPHRPQDVAAAVGLAADQLRILGQLRLSLQFLGQFRGHQLDRGQRRAELMRRRRDHATQVRQLLFPRQRHLRGQQAPGSSNGFRR